MPASASPNAAALPSRALAWLRDVPWRLRHHLALFRAAPRANTHGEDETMPLLRLSLEALLDHPASHAATAGRQRRWSCPTVIVTELLFAPAEEELPFVMAAAPDEAPAGEDAREGQAEDSSAAASAPTAAPLCHACECVLTPAAQEPASATSSAASGGSTAAARSEDDGTHPGQASSPASPHLSSDDEAYNDEPLSRAVYLGQAALSASDGDGETAVEEDSGGEVSE